MRKYKKKHLILAEKQRLILAATPAVQIFSLFAAEMHRTSIEAEFLEVIGTK
jgi:hypothetical protein